ncbi:MAG: MFS transporter, partial [Kordiimonadaceae bacterium]|nr:MFS transporter [Kordiimonadaceae bacterium]
QVYVDKKASAEIRSSAQSFITLLTYGFGLAIGTMLSGRVIDALTTDGVRDWSTIWMIPGIFAAVIAVIFFFTFNENEKAKEVD